MLKQIQLFLGGVLMKLKLPHFQPTFIFATLLNQKEIRERRLTSLFRQCSKNRYIMEFI
jgi:hypothetical protein